MSIWDRLRGGKPTDPDPKALAFEEREPSETPKHGTPESEQRRQRSRERGSPRNVSALEAQELLRKNENVVLDLWAAWCHPCRALRPIFDFEAEKFAEQAVFARVNIEHDPSFAQRFEVRSIPTILFFRDGQLVRRSVGMTTAPALEKQIRRAFRL